MVVLDRLLRWPKALLGVTLLVSLLLSPLLRRLNLHGDLLDLLPRSSKAAQAFASYSKHMVASQELVVLVTCSEPSTLTEFAERYSQALSKLPEVAQVTHRISGQSLRYLRDHLLLLLDEDDIAELGRRLTPAALDRRASELRGLLSAPGGSSMAPLLTADPLELVPLITRRMGSGLKVDATSGYLRTADGTALLIKVRPRFAPLEWERDQKLIADASELARSLGAEVSERNFTSQKTPRVAFTGAYAFPPFFRLWIEKDMTLSTILSVGAVFLLFAIFFRSLRILPWVLLPLSLAGLWTGLAATLLFGRISGVSLAFATILVAIGIDLPIQLYSRLREELHRAAAEGRSVADAVRHTTVTMAGAATVATLGPAAVFFACGLSDFGGLNQLGMLAGVGLLLNCVAMLTVFPALLLTLPAKLWHKPSTYEPSQQSLVAQLGSWIARHPRPILGLSVVLLLVALPQVRKVHVAHDLLSIDLGEMPPALTQSEISRRFGEQQRFLVTLVESADPDEALYRAEQWQKEAARLVSRSALVGYEAIGTLLPSQRTQNERRKLLQALNLPASSARLRESLERAGFDAIAFATFLDLLGQDPSKLPSLELSELAQSELGFLVRSHVADIAGPDARRMVALYLFAPADERLSETVKLLEHNAEGSLGGLVTGMPLLEEQLRKLLERDLLHITLASLGLVVLLLVVYYRRLRPVVVVLLPLSLAWVLFGTSLVVLGIPLHLYNLLAVPLVIGYGIDDHIFLVHRFQVSGDIRTSLATAGRAIVLTTLSTVAGFLALLIAHFPGLRQFGLSGALAVLLCLLAALLVLPALLSLLWPQSAIQNK
ncbi:MAG: MMPL family transporter [Myxococcales bacterium]|nr:MMPL family transporter [Myxococcales bacterium]